jgi:hypothetical protein
MVVVEFRVALEAGSVSACSVNLELGRSRNSPGGRWNAVFTGPAWKPAFGPPKEIVEFMILQ